MDRKVPHANSGLAGEAITVAAVQMATRIGEKEHNLQQSLEWLTQAANAGAHVAVMPELGLSGYAPSTREEAFQLAESVPGPSVAAWIDLAAETGLVVVGGLCEQQGQRCYNSAVAVDGTGILGVYRKAHLFEREAEVFDRGDSGFPVVDLGFARLGILVCYDLRFPEATRTLALSGADIVAVPTAWVTLDGDGRLRNDGVVCMQAHCAMAQASMNRVYFACAGTVGVFRDTEFLGNSLITDISGWPIAGPAGRREESLLIASLVPTKSRDKHITPYNDVLSDRRMDLYSVGGERSVMSKSMPGRGGSRTDRRRVDWGMIPKEQRYEGVTSVRHDSEHVTVIRYEFSAGAQYPVHQHHHEQLVYVLDGRARFTVGDDQIVLETGDLLHVDPGTPHGATAESTRAVFLTISPRREQGT